jgi:hypothetical protein
MTETTTTTKTGMDDVLWGVREEDYERINRYCRGGYHPVHLNQSFEESRRYIVFYKIW